MKEKIAENAGKIKQNKVLPYLVGNVVEVSVGGLYACFALAFRLGFALGSAEGLCTRKRRGKRVAGSLRCDWRSVVGVAESVNVDLGDNRRVRRRKAHREDCFGGGISPAGS